jgi:hypothetical protein
MNTELCNPFAYSDRAETAEFYHHARRLQFIKSTISDDYISEHLNNPFAYRVHHSLTLQRIDRFLKTYPIGGKRLAVLLDTDNYWKISVLQRDAPSYILSGEQFETLSEAVHRVFVIRFNSLKNEF